MGLADEIAKLHDLRSSGALTEEEFHLAKRRLLEGDDDAPLRSRTPDGQLNDLFEHENSLGEAANRYVTMRIIMGIIGAIVFIIFALTIFSNSPGHVVFGPLR